MKPVSFKEAQISNIISHETELPFRPFRVDSKFKNPDRIVLTPWPPDDSEELLSRKEFEKRQYFLVMDLVREKFEKK